MTDFMEYVKWRGDLLFENDDINYVDCAVFSELSHLPLENIVPSISNSGYITVEDAAKILFSYDMKKRFTAAIIPTKDIQELFKGVSKCERYKHVKMCSYINIINDVEEKQFSAITYDIGDTMVVVYRGTDDTIVGWKENFNMSFSTPVPAQQHGVEYLDTVASLTDKRIIVCGHSKGGNLAVYSSACSSDVTRKRIEKIYNFDGPGFRCDVLEKIRDKSLEKKITNIMPEGAVVGRIFDNVGENIIVKSRVKWLSQHNMFTWKIIGKEFVKSDTFTEDSDQFHSLLNMWVTKMTKEELSEFVDSLFKLIRATDASTLSEISESKLRFIVSVLRSDEKTKKTVWNGIAKLMKEKRQINKKLAQNKAKVRKEKKQSKSDSSKSKK